MGQGHEKVGPNGPLRLGVGQPHSRAASPRIFTNEEVALGPPLCWKVAGLGGKAAQDVITPVPEIALLAHFSVSARLPELLPPQAPPVQPRPLLHSFWDISSSTLPMPPGAGECGEHSPQQVSCPTRPSLSVGSRSMQVTGRAGPDSLHSHLSSASLLMDLL